MTPSPLSASSVISQVIRYEIMTLEAVEQVQEPILKLRRWIGQILPALLFVGTQELKYHNG